MQPAVTAIVVIPGPMIVWNISRGTRRGKFSPFVLRVSKFTINSRGALYLKLFQKFVSDIVVRETSSMQLLNFRYVVS
jgi:hypothetical protein